MDLFLGLFPWFAGPLPHHNPWLRPDCLSFARISRAMKFKKMFNLHFDSVYASINYFLKKQKMKKNSIILLALAATAHVHGSENTLNKHNHELILGKRAYPDPNANDNLAKRQRTDQNPPEQSGISMVPAVKFTDSQELERLLAEKYNNNTKQWEEVKGDDKLNGCVVHCRTTLLIPSIPNAMRGLPGIIGNKRVNHIIIGALDSKPRSKELWDIINRLFTDTNPNNNSLTCRGQEYHGQASKEMAWIMNQNVKNLILEGTNRNKRLDIKVPSNVGNKCVTIRNFSNGTLKKDPCDIGIESQDCEIILKGDNIRLTSSNGSINLRYGGPRRTQASGLNVQMTFDNEIVMAKSDDGQVCHYDYIGLVMTQTTAYGTNAQVTIEPKERTIEAKSDTKVTHRDTFSKNRIIAEDCRNSINIAEGLNSTIRRHGNSITIEGDTKAERTEYDNEDRNGDRNYNIRQFEFIAEGKKREDAGIGNAELTRPQIIVDDHHRKTIKSDKSACCTSYEKGKIDYRTCAYGTNAKVTLCENEGGITGEADKDVCYEQYHKNGKLLSRTGAHGTNATLSITGTKKIEGKGNNGVLHQRFFDNGDMRIQAAVNGNAKLTVEECGAIKGTTNTEAQCTRLSAGTLLHHG
jgi:hypothetical protein